MDKAGDMKKRGAKKITFRAKRLLKKRSIQFTISITFTLVAVLGMIAVAVSLSMRFIEGTKEMVVEDNRRMVEQVNLNLDNYLHNMMRVSNSMYYTVIKNADLSQDSIDAEMSLLYETYRDLLVSVAVFSGEGDVIAAQPIAQLKQVDPTSQDWFIKATERIENLHFSTPHVQNLFMDADNRYKWVVSLSRAVELTERGTVRPGVLLVDMNFSGIEHIFKNVDLGERGYLYLIDGRGEIIYHPRQQLIYSNLISENNYAAASYGDGSYTETFDAQERMITVKTVGYTGWKIIGVEPMSDITANYDQIQLFSGFFVVFSAFLLAFINLYLSSRIANPIKELDNSVKEIEKGVLDVEVKVSGSYEVEHLGSSINSMVAQMRRLMDDIVVEQEAKRRSEMDALQSQINPHFLYNTLDSIVWMIENERYDGAIQMVSSLAKLFRISLSGGKNIITVADELEHVRNYLTIQSIRFKNKFEYEIKAQVETLRLATIKLIVQPLVENAIYHGLEFMSDGQLKISSYLKDGELYIDVMDNGLGMPQEEADALLQNGAAHKTGKGSGVGLKNVNERISLCFGAQYGLKLISEPDVGTVARVRLPAIPIEDLREEGGYDA